jgi:hypothetical protein
MVRKGGSAAAKGVRDHRKRKRRQVQNELRKRADSRFLTAGIRGEPETDRVEGGGQFYC